MVSGFLEFIGVFSALVCGFWRDRASLDDFLASEEIFLLDSMGGTGCEDNEYP